jgi:hypothetical protein
MTMVWGFPKHHKKSFNTEKHIWPRQNCRLNLFNSNNFGNDTFTDETRFKTTFRHYK